MSKSKREAAGRVGGVVTLVPLPSLVHPVAISLSLQCTLVDLTPRWKHLASGGTGGRV